MNFTVSRNKNILFFQSEGKAKPYAFDVNTAIFYGLSDKPIKTWPTGLGKWIENHTASNSATKQNNVITLIRAMREFPNTFFKHFSMPDLTEIAAFANLFSVADRLQSIGYIMLDHYGDTDPDNLNTVIKHFKAFAKYVKENDNPRILNFCQLYAESDWRDRHHLIPNDFLTEEMISWMWRYVKRYPEKYTSHIAYYLSHGLYEFCDIQPYSGRFSDNSGTDCLLRLLSKYFHYCEATGMEPEKDNFYRGLINVRRQYLTNQISCDVEALKAHYAKHPELAFEDDNFIVILPHTREDFIKEALAQDNCVYSHYFERVVTGETYVVFVRRKNSINKSYITCEVSTKTGTIIQYLTTYNNHVRDEDGLAFEEAYQKHLLDNWKK